MGSATRIIVLNRIFVGWWVFGLGSAGGLFGIVFGLVWLADILPGEIVKLSFTLMLSSYAVTLYLLNRNPRGHHPRVPKWGNLERTVVFVAGVLGGVISGIVGNGIDMPVFVVMFCCLA